MWNVVVSADDTFDKIKETALKMAEDFMRKKQLAARHEYLQAKKIVDYLVAERRKNVKEHQFSEPEEVIGHV